LYKGRYSSRQGDGWLLLMDLNYKVGLQRHQQKASLTRLDKPALHLQYDDAELRLFILIPSFSYNSRPESSKAEPPRSTPRTAGEKGEASSQLIPPDVHNAER